LEGPGAQKQSHGERRKKQIGICVMGGSVGNFPPQLHEEVSTGSGVPLEVFHKKRGVDLQLHLYLGAGPVWLDNLGAEPENLEWSSPKQPLRMEGVPYSIELGYLKMILVDLSQNVISIKVYICYILRLINIYVAVKGTSQSYVSETP
jgi:hypothetical protein